MNGEKKFEVHDLIERGKAKGSLSNSEIMEAIEDIDYDIEQKSSMIRLREWVSR